jgi:hypothetical protein
MKNHNLLAALILIVLIPVPSHTQNKKQIRDLVGTYETCLMGCTVIKVRSDFTFSYQPMSDVGEPEIVEGIWKLEEPNIIVANTFEQPDKYTFITKLNRNQRGFIVRISDRKGMPIQYSEVRIPTESGLLIGQTNEKGIAEFPPCEPRGMTVGQPFSNYVNNSALFSFPDDDFNYVEAKITFIPTYITNEKWLIQKGKLYFIKSEPIPKVK